MSKASQKKTKKLMDVINEIDKSNESTKIKKTKEDLDEIKLNEKIKFISVNLFYRMNGGFLNGMGTIKRGKKDVVSVKRYEDNSGEKSYISAQAYRKLLRESFTKLIGQQNYYERLESKPSSADKKKNPEKFTANPFLYPEDDFFGYIHPKLEINLDTEEYRPDVVAVTRIAPVRSSVLLPVDETNKIIRDNGFIHLKDDTPLPYTSEFVLSDYRMMLGIELDRIGRFQNIGDRIELDPKLKEILIAKNEVIIRSDDNSELIEFKKRKKNIKENLPFLFQSILNIEGGAKSSQLAVSFTPRLIILVGLKGCNFPFTDCVEGEESESKLRIDLLKTKVKEYKEIIGTNLFIGLRSGFLSNEKDIMLLNETEIDGIKIIISSPGNCFKLFLQDMGVN